MTPAQLAEIRAFAVEIAEEAGRLTLEYFQRGVSAELKSDNSPVTIADRRSEELLRDRIARRFPAHGVLGEEHGETTGSEPGRWILDPIDGTFSFISGVPLYCVLVGFEWQGEMAAGVIHMPALRETIHAARGQGCAWNAGAARVSDTADLAQARISCTSMKWNRRNGREAHYQRLLDGAGHDRGWPDGYAYALLATGRVDVVVDAGMHIWDTAAVLPCVTEAGGTLTDFTGVVDHRRPEAVGTNGRLFEAVMGALGG